MLVQVWIAGSIAGLASLPHCAAMCGPLAAFACRRSERRGAAWRYQAGRTLGYGALGAVAGSLGAKAAGLVAGPWGAALVSWTLAAALAVAALRAWESAEPMRLRQARAPRPRESNGRSWGDRILARLPREPAALGAVTALLPCGALAAGVALAASSGSAGGGLATMLAFATASGGGLLASGWVARRFASVAPRSRSRALASFLAIGALVLLWRPAAALRSGGAGAMSCPYHGAASESPMPVPGAGIAPAP